MSFRELDVVYVAQLLTSTRPVDGTGAVVRQPRVGDLGTIVNVLGENAFTVECVDEGGLTLWLADFLTEELEARLDAAKTRP